MIWSNCMSNINSTDTDPTHGGSINTKLPNCSAIIIKPDSLGWENVSSEIKLPFICQRPHCNESYGSSFSCHLGNSYQLNTNKQTLVEANRICANKHGNLASFTRGSLNSYLVSAVLAGLQHKHDDINVLNVLKYLFQGPLKTRNIVENVFQFILVQLQLTIVMGLCLDNGESLSSKILRTKVMQFFGRISLSLYLLQLPVFGYIRLLMIQSGQFNDTAWRDFCLFYLIIVITPGVAYLVTKYFQEPCSRLLRGK